MPLSARVQMSDEHLLRHERLDFGAKTCCFTIRGLPRLILFLIIIHVVQRGGMLAFSTL